MEEVEEEVVGLSSDAGAFCWTRAIKPGMLSLEEGVG